MPLMKILLTFILTLEAGHHYRPQRSCGKVMFSQASVILFTGGVSALGCVWQTPPPQADAPHQADTPLPGACWGTPPLVATAADGTHPTGMHSCSSKYILHMYWYFAYISRIYSGSYSERAKRFKCNCFLQPNFFAVNLLVVTRCSF